MRLVCRMTRRASWSASTTGHSYNLVVVSKQVTAVAVCTLLALVAAMVWVPTVMHSINTHGPQPGFDVHEWRLVTRTVDWHRLRASGTPMIAAVIWSIRWPVLLTEQTLILLLGGGLLTFVVRRERRRHFMLGGDLHDVRTAMAQALKRRIRSAE